MTLWLRWTGGQDHGVEASGNERQGIDDHPVALTVTADNAGGGGSERVRESDGQRVKHTDRRSVGLALDMVS